MSHKSTEHIYFGFVYSVQIISLRSLRNISSLFLGRASRERVKVLTLSPINVLTLRPLKVLTLARLKALTLRLFKVLSYRV